MVDSFPFYLTFDDVLLVPQHSTVVPAQADTTTRLTPQLVLSAPFLSAAMDTVTTAPLAIALARSGGLGVIHRNMTATQQADEVQQVKTAEPPAKGGCCDSTGRLCVAAAVGVGAQARERANALARAQVDMLIVDTAHGHSASVLETVRALCAAHPNIPLGAGNIVTAQAAADLIEAGAQCIKVGVGPGSICTTRTITGVGVPQLSAIMEVMAYAKDHPVTVIADGGIHQPGDAAKALAAGAHAVMLGSIFAACDEAPGRQEIHNGVAYRYYRGMGSHAAMKEGSADRYFQDPSQRKLTSEGVESLVRAIGPAADAFARFTGGLQATMGYLGCAHLADLPARAQFIRITGAGRSESDVHDVVKLTES
ncbi:MAG: IMP dehydrogenase [Pseudomonadota bacterium]